MELTELLHRIPDDLNALNTLMPLVYGELKKLAKAHLRREIRAVPLETTALVHEAFLKLAASRQPAYENRAHFYGITSRLMRQVLVDAARAKTAEKRSAQQEVPISEVHDRAPRPDRSLLALEDALQWLEKEDMRKARLIEMRFFGGMTAEESAVVVNMPVHIVRRELRLAQAWLRKQMACDDAAEGIAEEPARVCV